MVLDVGFRVRDSRPGLCARDMFQAAAISHEQLTMASEPQA